MKDAAGASFVIAIVVYMTFMGMLGHALGYDVNGLNVLYSIDLPGAFELLAIPAYIVGCLGSFMSIVSFSLMGDIPLWFAPFFIIPLVMGFGWMLLQLIRG